MPLTTRTPSTMTGPAAPQPAPHPQRAWWFDWLLTLPILLLMPVVLVPYLVRGAEPMLQVRGAPIAGENILIRGSNFTKGDNVQLLWDGQPTAWLPAPKVWANGHFKLRVTLPTDTPAGDHQLAAALAARAGGAVASPAGSTVATLTVSVTGSDATPEPTREPTPRPEPSKTPQPTREPDPTPVATPKPTPEPEPSNPPAPPPADGKVVGYGAGTAGGAGGRRLVVSNLADSGPGSLRAAVEASGKRTVVFEVAGTITLKSSITAKDPFLTIAGETAPAPGITLRNGSLFIRTSEVIVRHLRLRPGDQLSNPSDADALTINGASGSVSNVVVDHVTMLWGPDIGGIGILGDVRNVTVQNSIMGEGLYLSAHAEATKAQGGHSMAANVTQLDPGLPAPRSLTFWRNLFTTSGTRMPRFQGAECVDVVNNVIYNWGRESAHGNPRSLNLVNNWYRSGPLSEGELFWEVQTSAVSPKVFDSAVYLSGNVADGISGGREGASSVYAGGPRCGGLSVAAGDPRDAYAAVLDGAGAIAPVRDAVDRRVIGNVINRTGGYFNGAGYPSPNPYWP
ncbi:MAG TPA: hypothetical protein VH987_10095 [Candidatus Limnocylindria bacterium]